MICPAPPDPWPPNGGPPGHLAAKGLRAIAEATGNWPIRGWSTAQGLPPEIAERWPWNRRSAANSLAENLDGTPEDDDLNFPMLGLALLERHGRDFTTADVAQAWLDELPAGRVFTAERVAYRNLLLGVEPPRTATYRNPFREWIGARIRADVYGWVNPGDPAGAAAMAHRDACLSHTANGVYGAMFAAAMCATALVAGSVEEVLRAGRAVLPENSRMARAVDEAVASARAEPGGAPAIPEAWTAPLRDRMASSLTGFDGVRIGEMAARTVALASGRTEGP